MPNPSNLYICPRCLYSTPQKRLIKRHFETLKRPCPNKTGIELTKAICEYIYLNHQYTEISTNMNNDKLTKTARTPTFNQTINYYNGINGILTNMESADKLEMLTDRQGIRQIDFEDRLEKVNNYLTSVLL